MKTSIITKIIALFCILSTHLAISAQTQQKMIIYQKDGSITTYAVSQVDSISFEKHNPNEPIRITDDSFQSILLEQADKDSNGEVSRAEAETVTTLNLSAIDLRSLQGIEYFTNLDTLLVMYNYDLSEIDVRQNKKLKYLNCMQNGLNTLRVEGLGQLEYLNCVSNNLKDLTLNGLHSLKELDCSSNPDISSLSIEPCKKLNYLGCSGLSITKLDVTTLQEIVTLLCEGCSKLTDIYVNGCSKLENVYANNCNFKTLDLECESLKLLWVSTNNNLVSLNLSKCPNLETLQCEECNLTNKLNITDCTKLKNVFAGTSHLSGDWDLTTNISLETLSCQTNDLASINIQNIPSLKSIYCSWNPNLTKIKVQGCNSLESITSTYCSIADLNLDGLGALKDINIESESEEHRQLNTLTVKGCTSLESIDISYCALKELDLSEAKSLLQLTCTRNFQLEKLVMNNLENLFNISCMFCNLKELDLSNAKNLNSLYCSDNKMEVIRLSVIPTYFSYGNDEDRIEISREEDETGYWLTYRFDKPVVYLNGEVYTDLSEKEYIWNE